MTTTGTPADLIPANLNMPTADRLRLVADIIEQYPHWHDQQAWADGVSPEGVEASDMEDPDPGDWVGAGACGASHCAAGWGVACSPADAFLGHANSWEEAGTRAFGLDQSAAWRLFRSSTESEPLVAAMRFLADQPEEQRTAETLAAHGYLWRDDEDGYIGGVLRLPEPIEENQP